MGAEQLELANLFMDFNIQSVPTVPSRPEFFLKSTFSETLYFEIHISVDCRFGLPFLFKVMRRVL